MALVPSWGYADSDEEFAEEGEKGFSGKTALLLMVDSTPEMFENWKGEDNAFRVAIKCCQAILRSRIVSNEKDLVGLLFVGTEKSKNSSSFANLYQLLELSPVTVKMIEEVNAMKNSENFNDFEDNIGSSDVYDLKEAFWLAKIIFDEGKATTYQKKIMYFTRTDDPHKGKSNLQKEVVKKYKDIGKVELNIVAFNDDFNFENFYSGILEDESSIIKPENVDGLMKVVRVKQRLKRPISRSTLELAPGVKLGIGFYSFIRSAKPPKLEKIDKRSNEVLEKTVKEFHTETGMPVLKSEERKMMKIQGEEIVFTKEDIKQMKYVYEPGVKLIGFLNMDDFNHFTWYRSPGYFIYPDDERISGSKDLFTALLKRCSALKKVALVRAVLSRGRSPKLAVLIPSLEDPIFPQGFHMFLVPFSDEMRKYDFEVKADPSEELISLMEKVIKKITNKSFDILDVHNPKLQYLWRELERLALDLTEDDQDEFHDFTDPNEDLMLQRLGNLPAEIENEVEAYTGANQFQKTKSTASVSTVNMAMEAKHKRLDKLTVPVLKAFLDSKNINTARMRKADLVEAAYKYLDQHDE